MASDPPLAPPPLAAEAAAAPAPPAPVPAEPVSPAKEWAAAIALMIVLGLMAFEFVEYLRASTGP